MTIGIAAFGPNAGRAVIRALAAVESVGRGAIGGFVSFVAIAASGRIERAETQRGGSAALFSGGIATMPIALAEARIAGLMSSGFVTLLGSVEPIPDVCRFTQQRPPRLAMSRRPRCGTDASLRM